MVFLETMEVSMDSMQLTLGSIYKTPHPNCKHDGEINRQDKESGLEQERR